MVYICEKKAIRCERIENKYMWTATELCEKKKPGLDWSTHSCEDNGNTERYIWNYRDI